MNEIIQNFQLIRPMWLLGLIPVLVVYLLKLKFGRHQNLWQQLLPQHLYQKMVISKGLQKNGRYIHYAFFAWIIGVVAITGPSWEKLPQAVYQTQAGKVILMDMSMSMRSTDLAPNRLTRARFKAIDLINQVSEGETGLVAYAGDAFVISPLTDDVNTLNSLIPSLRPEIMPSQGSSALSGLEIASELLGNAGYQSGQIYWLTDGILYDEISDVRAFIQNSDFDVSALLVGTENGAPIMLEDGKLLKDSRGSIVVPSINSRYLNQAMSGTDGTYSIFASDNSDIASIKRKLEFEQQQQAKEVENTAPDLYKDMGPYLLLLILPFAAYAFRRGLLVVAFVCVLSLPSEPVLAMQTANGASAVDTSSQPLAATDNKTSSAVNVADWFKNADQKGKQAFDSEDYERANALFEDAEWLAASAYKKGDYQQAFDAYEQLPGLENRYNKGNALAKLGKLEDAISVYDEVLDADPAHANALKNKAIIEELLKQQKSQQEQQDSESGEQDSSERESSDAQSSDEQSSGEQEQSQSQDGESSESEQNQGESQDSEQSEGDQQSSDQQSSDQQNAEQNEPANSSKQDENLRRQAQQQAEQEAQQEGQEQQAQQANPGEPQEVPEDQQQEAISAEQLAMQNLSPEEREEMKRMQMIMNKVPNDPAYLLQRKMMLEAYKRNRQPAPLQENW